MSLETEINAFLEDPKRKQQLMDSALKAMEERVAQTFQWRLPDTLAAECDLFVKEHIAPAIRAHLLSKKGPILEAALNAADEIGEKISAQLVDRVEKAMSQSYKADQIIKSLFQ